MPLINKAAVIFISQGLQSHLWYVAWQHKLVKSACYYQIPSNTATIHKSTVLHPLLPGARAGQSEAHLSSPTTFPSPSSCKSHYPPPLPTMPAATVGPGEENSVQTWHLHPKGARRVGKSYPFLLPLPFPQSLSKAFFPILIAFMILISLLLPCCRLMV